MPESNEIVKLSTAASKPSIRLPVLLAIVAILLAVGALLVALRSGEGGGQSPTSSTLAQVADSGVLRVGYEGYAPYVVEDANTGQVSGYSVDLAEYIANEAGWRVEWISTSPETKIVDLHNGRFDLMTEPIFRTISRAKEVTFTRPYAYFGYAAGIVRAGEKRFSSVEELNDASVAIAVRQGYTDETYVERNLPRAKMLSLQADDIAQVFLAVTSGQADIALADLEQVRGYAAEHESSVDTRFIDDPPALVPAGFMIRRGDFPFYAFLNASIDYMESNAVLDRLDAKYGVSTLRDRPVWSTERHEGR